MTKMLSHPPHNFTTPLKITHTIKIQPLGNKFAAVIYRNWQHPRTRGTIPLSDAIHPSHERARLWAETELAHIQHHTQQQAA